MGYWPCAILGGMSEVLSENEVVRIVVDQPTGHTYRLPLPVRLLLQNTAGLNEVIWIDEPNDNTVSTCGW